MKIALLGDLGLFGKYDLSNNNELFKYFEKIKKYLDNFDLVVANLETPITREDNSYVCKSAHIKTSKKSVETLKFLNIELVNLANNHMFDYGKKGFLETLSELERQHIKYFGIQNKVEVYEKEKIVFSGFCCLSSNPSGINRLNLKRSYVNVLVPEVVYKTLKNYHLRNYINITSMHLGDEHIHYPRAEHIKFMRELSDNCPYILYGHHPHVIQGIENYKDSLHAYSLGNFCFDDVYTKQSNLPKVKQEKANKESYILELEIIDGKLCNFKTTPIFDNGKEILIELNTKVIDEQIAEYSRELKNDKNYLNFRTKILNSQYSKRKSTRDLNWYFNRINYNTIGTLTKATLNNWLYKKLFKKYL